MPRIKVAVPDGLLTVATASGEQSARRSTSSTPRRSSATSS